MLQEGLNAQMPRSIHQAKTVLQREVGRSTPALTLFDRLILFPHERQFATKLADRAPLA